LTIESGISFGKRFCVCQAVRKDLSRCMFWGQNMGPTADETLKLGTTDHSEDRCAKGMSGGGV
jgi:hypothetical protein